MSGTSGGYTYIGRELELFSHASNWKGYVLETLKPYISGNVLEVGAGIGGTTQLLCIQAATSWTALEPDPALAHAFRANAPQTSSPVPVKLVIGTVGDLDPHLKFDCVLYMDVLEHIEDDVSELRKAAEKLNPGGRLVVLSPAHQFLYSPFDRAIGHYRRYSQRQLISIAPGNLKLELIRYMDVIGMLASLSNRWLLRQSMPHERQLRLWDTWMVPLSRIMDPLFRYRLGKSILAVWTKASQQ